jgi:hypothetical protein
MRFWQTKEEEIVTRMRRVLEDDGFVRIQDEDALEVWERGDSTVILRRVHSTHDPISATVVVPFESPTQAWNAKGLAILLEVSR